MNLRTNFPNMGKSVDHDGLKVEGWRTLGMLVISADDPDLTWPERELVNQLGEKFYGKRRAKA